MKTVFSFLLPATRGKTMNRIFLLSLVGLALGLGCAQNVSDINRVQPNAVKKSDLLGREWYVRNTVVDAHFTGALTFIGQQSKLQRVAFDVQEKALFAYRTYEFVEGSEAFGQKGDSDVPLKDATGAPVKHWVLKDYQRTRCVPNAAEKALLGATDPVEYFCGAKPSADTKCASAAVAEEADFAGNCIQKATRFVYRGAPIMAFPIGSHFDIKRGYSPATGEKSNVIEENTTDRKWYDREYMRVAWGDNAVLSLDGDVAVELLVTAGQSKAVSLFQGDTAPEGEQLEIVVDGAAPQKYLTFINNMVYQAPLTELEGYGTIPLCYFYPWYSGGVFDCSSEQVKIRTFFLEVPQLAGDKAYVSLDQDDRDFEKFGYFRTERPKWELEFGSMYSGAIRKVNRHRIWESYVRKLEPAGKGVAAGEFAIDPSTNVWKGDFDYAKMTPQPIVYYLSEDFPRDLVADSIAIAKGWNVAFMDTVKALKGAPPAHDMFILCENNDATATAAIQANKNAVVAEYSTAGTPNGTFCKDMNTVHRNGDLRYSFMYAVNAPNQAGLYGYGPSAADPVTGEIISASAYAYVAPMQLGASRALDVIEFISGVKDYRDIQRASDITTYQKARRLKLVGSKSPKSNEEAVQWAKNLVAPDTRQRLDAQGLQLVDNGASWAQSRMSMIQKDPTLDAMLIDDQDGNAIKALFKDPRIGGKYPGVTQDQLKTMSLANWAHTAGFMSRSKAVRDLEIKTLHFDNFFDNAITGIAYEYAKFYDEALCKAYAAEVNTGKTTFDLPFWQTHLWDDGEGNNADCAKEGDFEFLDLGSGRVCIKTGPTAQWADCSAKLLMKEMSTQVIKSDAMNKVAMDQTKYLPSALYTNTKDSVLSATQLIGRNAVDKVRADLRPKLWRKIYKGTEEHEVGHTLGLRHNFEASSDALNYHKDFWALKLGSPTGTQVVNPWSRETNAQALGKIRELQLSSTMDYAAKFNSDFAGLGHYDRAAIKFGYGQLVETFNTSPMNATPAGLQPLASFLDEPEQTIAGLVKTTEIGNGPMNRVFRRVHYSTYPSYFGSVDAMYDRKDVPWRAIKGDRCTADADCGGDLKCRSAGTQSGAKFCTDPSLIEVPYRFCSDEWNYQTPTCATFDEGADPYEIARNSLDTYEQYWPFYGFRRDSETFHPNNYAARVEGAFMVAHRQFQFWAQDYVRYNKDGWWEKKYGKRWEEDVNGGLSGALATRLSFNTFMQVSARPTCGYYGWNAAKSRFEPANNQPQDDFKDFVFISEEEMCRDLYPGWDFSGYIGVPATGGQIYDRLAAMQMLADPTANNFMGVAENEDSRRYLISYFNFFPNQILQLFGGMTIEDASLYGWYVMEDGSLVPPDWANGGKAPQTGSVRYRMFPDPRPFFPSSRFRTPLLGAFYGMSLLTQGYDRSFMDLSRVFLKGNMAQIDFPAGTNTAEFHDCLSGKIYVAAETSDATDVVNPGYLLGKEAQGIGGKVTLCEGIQADYLFSEYQFIVSLLEIVRGMHKTYEY